jgi:putative peptidoglycan lipid II flippase
MKGAGIISGLTFLSRILGLFREALFAALFELSLVADAFLLAYQIPNLFRKLFGEGALSAAFIPVYTDYLEHRSSEERNRFGSILLTLLGLLLGGITTLGLLSSYFFPEVLQGLESREWIRLFSQLFRIMFPYMFLICLVAVLGGLLNAHKHFAAPAAAPVLMNVVIVSILCGVHYMYQHGTTDLSYLILFVAAGVLVGGVVQFLLQIPPLRARGFRYRFALEWDHPGLQRVLSLMGPSVVGLAVVQVNLLMDSVIALVLVPGSGAITSLWLGNRVMQVPFALIGVAISTAAFPYFSSHASKGNYDRLAEQVMHGVQITLFLAIPSSVGLAILAEPSVRLLFEYGNFGATETARTGSVLLYYSTGIWAFCVYHVMTRAFYAVEDTMTPARVATWMVGLNICLNVLLVVLMNYSETGIALSTSITSVVNVGVLVTWFRLRYEGLRVKQLLMSLIRCTVIAGVMGLGTFLALVSTRHSGIPGWFGELGARVIQVVGPVLSGVVLYLGLMYLIRAREILQLTRRLLGHEPDGQEG